MTVLRIAPFRNLLIGGTISQLGDVFFIVALPWIVMQLTPSGAALGGILMLAAVPRAALMLVGGAISDRISARTILLAGNACLALAVGALAFAAATHALTLWMLAAIALIFGITDAFASPALKVLVPSIVSKDEIASANSLLQTATQLCLLGGAAIAGILMQRFGIVPALIIDACSFVFLILALVGIHDSARALAASSTLLASIREGVSDAFRDPATRTLLIVIAGVNLCLTGASQVGIAALIHQRFASAGLYGVLVTVTAIGSLAGVLLAGSVPAPKDVVPMLLWAAAALGGCIAILAVPMPLAGLIAVLLVAGAISGYVNVQVISTLQTRVDRARLGRIMSIVALSSAGLAPLSLAIAGCLAQWSLALLFGASGAALVAVTIVGFRYRSR